DAVTLSRALEGRRAV
ncbi:MAG: hypothetical protein ACOYBJ_03050, partial [Patescibacteria group bacterium]